MHINEHCPCLISQEIKYFIKLAIHSQMRLPNQSKNSGPSKQNNEQLWNMCSVFIVTTVTILLLPARCFVSFFVRGFMKTFGKHITLSPLPFLLLFWITPCSCISKSFFSRSYDRFTILLNVLLWYSPTSAYHTIQNINENLTFQNF